ncbi:MAG: HesA/MoeB/ThiF family protein [Desulfobacula sp.]|nr:HesA/MoeB/ThiF family protein [Desulfobacula sp.]
MAAQNLKAACKGRYARQILLPQIGSKGQKTLAKASVLIAGAGGLGSISSLYLAAAGVGHIIIADHDHVEESNLNRQLLHSETSLGIEKVKSAANRIKELNSSIKITPVQKQLTAKNIDSLVKKVDIIVDACDNYKTRQVLNRASIRHCKPFVFAGVQGFNGMVSCFIPKQTPCFECIVKPPQKKTDKGILGATAGIAASIQAMETIKLLLNIGTQTDRLENRLLRISGLNMKIKSISLEPDPDCKICKHIYPK